MSTMSKRIVALVIDAGIVGMALVFCAEFGLVDFTTDMFHDFLGEGWKNFVIQILGALVLYERDLIFRHASIGKKIMGLVVVDRDGKIPSIKKIAVRSIVTITAGYAIFLLYLVTKDSFVDWEMKHLNTQVVEKKFWKKTSFDNDLLT